MGEGLVAAAEWLENAKEVKPEDGDDLSFDYTKMEGWNGQWLHWTGREADKEEAPPPDLLAKIRKLWHPTKLGPPPPYYAVLMIDGDELGEWLASRSTCCSFVTDGRSVRPPALEAGCRLRRSFAVRCGIGCSGSTTAISTSWSLRLKSAW